MAEKVRVAVVLPISPPMLESIRGVSDRLDVIYLSAMQRLMYREGRPLWPGYNEPPAAGDETEEQAKATVEAVLSETEVLLSNPIVPDTILERAPNLKWVQLTSAGVDRLIDSALVRSGKATVTTASGIHAVPIGEYVIGAMLAFAKGFPRAFRGQQKSTWQAYLATELEASTVGILGLGAIGGHVARLARGLGMRVVATRRSQKERMTGDDAGQPFVDEMFPTGEIPAMLGQCDYVVLAVPLTDESRHLISEAELRAMKPNAVIVNIARGAVIDQPALIKALKAGQIGGAALDVTDPEPLPSDSELWGLDNVMITPHISGGTPKYMDRAIELFRDNLRRYLDGDPLRNVVDPSRGY
jgi:phosphoglycerate dehydrogenase-like enzyme